MLQKIIEKYWNWLDKHRKLLYLFLICSDGVTDMISLHEIEAIIKNERTPKEAVDRLVKLALKNGGKDNITAIICDIVNG